MAKAKIYRPPHEREADCHKIHEILCAPDAQKGLGNDRWFSTFSNAHVFDMRGTCGVMQHNISDRQILDMLEETSVGTGATLQEMVHTRIIFIDEVHDDVDRLQCTSQLLQAIFQTYCVSSRVARLLERQHMPGRVVQYDPITKKPIHHQFWYSAIIRFPKGKKCNDSSKSILVWKRLCVWAGRDLSAGTTVMLVLRCPKDMRAELISSFADQGQVVMRQPMLLHAFFAQHSLQKADMFSETWADSIYYLEGEDTKGKDSTHFTARTRTFLTLAREITQIATDYEILGPALRHLKTEHEWIAAQYDDDHSGIENSTTRVDNTGLKDIWDVYLSELQLLRTYAMLYETRTQLAINECFAMVNQRDAEVNINIARSSREDGQSLRTIQILTMIFLPASLLSGIFGMGFFNTDTDDKGNIRFSVSRNWWWYPALTIPITAATMLTLVGRDLHKKWKTNKREHQNAGVGC